MKLQNLALLLAFAGLPACSQPGNRGGGEPELREVTAEEAEAARANRAHEETRYREALAAAPVYRSNIRDFLLEHPSRYRATGRIGIGDLWYGANRSKAFRCIHPEDSIGRAQSDGWELIRCDRHSAYFLRGRLDPTLPADGGRAAPTIDESFEVLRISYAGGPLDSRGAQPVGRPYAIRAALPGVYDRPTEAELRQLGISPGEGDDIRVAYYDFNRRKEISVYSETDQRVVTVVFDPGESATVRGARGTKLVGDSVVWVQSSDADFAAMTRLLSVARHYIAGIE